VIIAVILQGLPSAPQGLVLDVDAVSIILGVVSLVITVIGFFASLKFYRDGVELQKAANGALAKLEEKAGALQLQVGGMFEKTLDAAIGNRAIVSDNVADIQAQLEKLTREVIDQATQELGVAGQKERERLREILSFQLASVREAVETTQRSVTELAPSEQPPVGAAKQIDGKVLNALALRGHWLTLAQIARNSRINLTAARRAVQSLVSQGFVHEQLTLFDSMNTQPDLEGRTYGLTPRGRRAIHSDAY
jgi:hypothetical protein